MALTPEDVRGKRFTPVRLREGYDMGEVDQFLDEVETELERLAKERETLRAAASATADAPAAPAAVQEPATPAAASMTIGEASSAATRLLEIAGRNADELVSEAKDNADKIIGEARTKAERLESEAHARSERLDGETAERRVLLFGALDTERDSLEQEVASLRTFEREYRSRLKAYFEQQLQVLDGDMEMAASPLSDGDGESDTTPERLRSLLGDDAG